jgi:decaprenyl-phosphate phosphoribosyltransferase
MVKNYISVLRIHQYIKNLFIFLPLFFARHITDTDLIVRNIIAFVLFSMLASALYIVNDWRDLDEDCRHPVKKHRPLARGAVTVHSMIVLAILLTALSLTGAYYFERDLFFIFLLYLIIGLCYSFGLKRIPIIDLFIIAIGFVFRILTGAIVSGIPASMWIILMVFLLALFLGLAKRRDDILLSEEGTAVRKSVRGYNIEFVNASMIVMAPVILVSYISYTVSPQIIQQFQSDELYITAIFVIFGILRYLQITLVDNNSGDPTNILLTDRAIQLSIVGWILSYLVIIY